MVVGGQRHALVALPPGMKPSTHCTGGWVGLGTSLNRSQKIVSVGILTPDHPACG